MKGGESCLRSKEKKTNLNAVYTQFLKCVSWLVDVPVEIASGQHAYFFFSLALWSRPTDLLKRVWAVLALAAHTLKLKQRVWVVVPVWWWSHVQGVTVRWHTRSSMVPPDPNPLLPGSSFLLDWRWEQRQIPMRLHDWSEQGNRASRSEGAASAGWLLFCSGRGFHTGMKG